MKKLNKVAMLFASAALVTAAGAQTIDNWKNGNGELVWKNGTNELCWRDANWTPATAAPGCDGAIAVQAPAPVVAAPPAAPPDGRRSVCLGGARAPPPPRCPSVALAHRVRPKVAPRALVGDRGVHVAVGDNHVSAGQCRPDEGLDVVSPVRGEQQGFRARGHVIAVQHELANGAAERRATGLAGHHDFVAKALEPCAQQATLRRLARSVSALQGDEQAARGRRMLRQGHAAEPMAGRPQPRSRRHLRHQVCRARRSGDGHGIQQGSRTLRPRCAPHGRRSRGSRRERTAPALA